jgi:uncharacterized protein YggE
MRASLLALLLTAVIAVASPLPDYPFVYVQGQAVREVPPDKATISFNLKVFEPQAERAFQQQAASAEVVLAQVQKLGLPMDVVVAHPINKTAVHRQDDDGNDLEIIGYTLERAIQVNLDDLAPFSPLIEFLHTQPFITGISTEFSSRAEAMIMQELTTDACRMAQQNAERLSEGFKRKLGGVRAISENSFTGLGNQFGLPGELGYGAGGAMKRDFRVVPATITFHKFVYAIFALAE